MKSTTRTFKKNTLDPLWSKVIIAKDKKCLRCGTTENLQAHHIWGKSTNALRYALDNGACLCAGDHTFNFDAIHSAGSHGYDWKGLFIKKIGLAKYEALRLLKNVFKKYPTMDDLKELKKELQAELIKLEG